MTPTNFIEHVSAVMPTKAQLTAFGLNTSEIIELQNSFTILPKNQSITAQTPNELEDLIANYNCVQLVVGQIRFLSEITSRAEGKQFAYCEADPLIIGNDNIIYMLDHSNIANVISCAASPAQFLDALGLFLDLINNRNLTTVKEPHILCAEKAGGSKYIEFYTILYGGL